MGVIGHLGPSPTPRIMSATLGTVAKSLTLRCDARQSEDRFSTFDAWISTVPHFTLGELLPAPIVKGAQPEYSDSATGGIPVISTMAIQNLQIDTAACRMAATVDYGINGARKPREHDVLLTVDGGPSIGKPVRFDLVGDWAVDSHVAILRPQGLDPNMLVYLLASPIGQLQFQRAESGASGQTAVTEDDIRRFRFPKLDPAIAATALGDVDKARAEAARLRKEAEATEAGGWEEFLKQCAPGL